MSVDPALSDLLVLHHDALCVYVGSRGGRLLRYETVDDLVQGVVVRALERGAEFRFQGEERFLAWMYTVARSFLADRHAHWLALRRRPAGLFRLLQNDSETGDPHAVREPAIDATGPSTFASRREQITLALRALDLLFPRDRDLVRWTTQGLSVEEIAARLDVAPNTAVQARGRALGRLRKAHRIVTARSRGAGPA